MAGSVNSLAGTVDLQVMALEHLRDPHGIEGNRLCSYKIFTCAPCHAYGHMHTCTYINK